MNKLKNRSGMTLMEMLVSILILVMLVVAMGTGMNSGMRIYEDAIFESNSATLANIVNTTLSDILRYCEVKEFSNPYVPDQEFVITNLDYGIKDAYFLLGDGEDQSILQMKNTHNKSVVDLVNTGSSPDLKISEFKIIYNDTGYFQIEYKITSRVNEEKVREVTSVVRLLNTD